MKTSKVFETFEVWNSF